MSFIKFLVLTIARARFFSFRFFDDKYVFDKKYLVGNQVIDSEHKYLFYLVNKLEYYTRDVNKKPNKKIETIKIELVNYVINHFAHELRLIREYKIDESSPAHFARHIKAHDDFWSMLFKFNKSGDSKEMCEFLARWLYGHIAVMDAELAMLIGRQRVLEKV